MANMSKLFLYAHRGASADAPENTLAAFRCALDAGADGIELDVHLSHDGVPVVIHDDTLDRTTDGSGAVAAHALGSLKRLDAGRWFAPEFAGEEVPTLEETLQLLRGRLRINLEVKDVRAGMAVVNQLHDFPDAEVVVSSFDHGLLADLRRSNAALPLAMLFETTDWHRVLAGAERLRACAVHPRVDLVSRPLITACHQRHLPIYAWTVDSAPQAHTLEKLGIDGLFTNDPALLKSRRAGRLRRCSGS